MGIIKIDNIIPIELAADIEEAVLYDDIALAKNTLIALERFGKNHQLASTSNTPQAKEFERLVNVLRYIRFPNLANNFCIELVQKHFLLAYEIPDYDVKDHIRKKIVFLELDDDRIDFMNKMLDAFKHNEEVLGVKPLVFEGKTMPPILKNWLLDYDSFPTINPRRGNLETINYINKSPNPAQLNPQQRNILVDLCQIFDSLKNKISEYKSVPLTDNMEEAFRDFDIADTFPGLVREQKLQVPPSIARILGIDVIEAPRNTVPASTQVAKPQNLSPSKVASPRIQPPPLAKPAITPLVPRGPLDPEQYLAQKAKAKMAEIDKKIQDLKERSKAPGRGNM